MLYLLAALLALILLVTAALWSKLMVIVRYGGEGLSLTFKLWCFKYSLSGFKGSDKPKEKKDKKKKKKKKEDAEDEDKEENGGKDGGETDEKAKDEEKVGALQKIKDGISLFKSVKRASVRALKYLKHKIDISETRVRLKFGTGDAAATGMICGAFWAALGNLYIIGGKFFNLGFPSVNLTPVFESKAFELEAESIIEVRPAHIINAAVLALFTYFFQEKRTIKKQK